jgi:predicted SnoaL-like aldol condensation-catalyzing enzyme
LEQRNKAKIQQVYSNVLATGRADLIPLFFSKNFIQHDPLVSAGLQGVVEQVKNRNALSPRPQLVVKHIVADGPYVLVHSHLTSFPHNEFNGTALMDLFRLSGGMIVEHWALTQEVPSSTASGNSMFSDLFNSSNPTAGTTPAVEDGNKQLVSKLFSAVFTARDFSVIDKFWAGPAYIQHSPQVPNGTDGLKNFIANSPPLVVNIRIALAEGELVFTYSQLLFTNSNLNSDFTGLAAGDLFRVVNGVIVEHWDVLSPVLPDSANGNSAFSQLFVSPL